MSQALVDYEFPTHPVRYLELLPGVDADSVPIAAYMTAVQRARTIADVWFGLELQLAQLAAFAPGDRALFGFAASFHRIVVQSRRDRFCVPGRTFSSNFLRSWTETRSYPGSPCSRTGSTFARSRSSMTSISSGTVITRH